MLQTANMIWAPYADGIEIKRVVGIADTGPFINLLRLKKGSILAAGKSEWQQARYVVEGAIRWDGEEYDSISLFYYPPNADYPASEALVDDTLLFVVQWTTNEEQRPRAMGGSVF